MPFHIIDRGHRRFFADLDTREEAEQRLAEELEVNPDADMFIFSAGEDPSTPHPPERAETRREPAVQRGLRRRRMRF